MKILVLADDSPELDVEGHPEQVNILEEPGPRRDIALLLPRLNPARLEVQLMAVRGQRTDGRSLNARGGLDPLAWRQLTRLVKAQGIELIHALGPTAAFYAAIAGRAAGIATLASVYSFPNFRLLNAYQQVRLRIFQVVVGWGIDKIILPAEFFTLGLWRLHYPKARSVVIYPGVSIGSGELVAPSRAELGLPSGPLVTMVAPLVPDQGYKTLIEAVRRLIERVPDVRVAVVGSGPLTTKLHEQSRLLPILWLGNRSDVADVMATSDVITVHPRFDSLPRVIFEAAALGKPVVASRVHGILDIVEPNSTGMLVTYDDARDLSLQISRILLQANFREHLSEGAKRRAQRFSLDAQAEAITTLYEETVYSRR
jgi:glycosyltransferase involved in cell wall biosynthesis